MGVPNDRVGDTPHQRSPNPSTTSASHDYKPGASFFGEPHDLSVRVPQPRVLTCDLATRLPYPLHLFVEFGPGFFLCSLRQTNR